MHIYLGKGQDWPWATMRYLHVASVGCHKLRDEYT
jgi:hypothetical protein